MKPPTIIGRNPTRAVTPGGFSRPQAARRAREQKTSLTKIKRVADQFMNAKNRPGMGDNW